jgi:hypothetical protein
MAYGLVDGPVQIARLSCEGGGLIGTSVKCIELKIIPLLSPTNGDILLNWIYWIKVSYASGSLEN